MNLIETLEKGLERQVIKEDHPRQAEDICQTYADVSELIHDFDLKPDNPISTGWEKCIERHREDYQVEG